MPHSALQIPVPGLEPFVRDRTAHYDTDYLSTDPAYVHAHITVLAPFLPAVDKMAAASVAQIAARMTPFAFRLERVDTFPDGIVHLLPEPHDGFRALTAALWAASPQCPPYGGQFPDSTPHLTLDLVHADVTQASTERLLERYPRPDTHRAEQVHLAWYEPGACRVLQTWSLGRAH